VRSVDQTRFGPDGNCTAACLASLLELALEDVPDFRDDSDNARLNAWLAPRGLYAITLRGPQMVDGERWEPAGLHMLGGASVGGPHHVIALGGTIVHDPNPNRDGLVTREDYTLLVPFDPALVHP
jgi:hypothetical protein